MEYQIIINLLHTVMLPISTPWNKAPPPLNTKNLTNAP